MNDEIITEVRAIKEALAKESGFDIRRIAEEIRKSEVQSEAEGWMHVTARHRCSLWLTRRFSEHASRISNPKEHIRRSRVPS